jgi:RNA polymerase sigma factor (sigma-70 family)
VGASEAGSDTELAVQLRAGDAAALGQLYDRHVRGIHDFLARFTRDPAAAEDLVQSTFLRAWERRETLREPSRVRAWLYATAHNLALNHVTRARPASSADDEAANAIADPAPGPEEAALSRDAAELVWAAASSLEPRQYAVLDLSVRRELSTRELADVLDLPVSHAAVLVNRSREALGGAVRYLLVARRRDHCERLAALVPAGVQALTRQQRSAVDHHMRRCESCRDLGRRLTAPWQLLGALLPLPLPSSLGAGGRDRLVAAVRAQPAVPAAGGPTWPPRRRRWWDGRRRLALGALGALVLLLLAGGGGAAYVFRPSQASVAERTDQRGPGVPAQTTAVTPSGAVPSPSPSNTPTPSPSATPSATPAAATAPTPAASPVATAPGSTPTPVPSPAFGVARILVRTTGCPVQKDRTFLCGFSVTVTVVRATGPVVVPVTLTATTGPSPNGSPGVTQKVSFQVPVPSTGTGTGPVSASFPTCTLGMASATTVPASATPSNSVTFCLPGAA